MAKTKTPLHPFVVFWLGVLTGALVVVFIFFHGMMKSQDYQGFSFFRFYSPVVKTSQVFTPQTEQTVQFDVQTTAIGGNKGGY